MSSISGFIPIKTQYTYNTTDYKPTAGVNYYRAKIWMGSQYVYTETISIIHHGEQLLFFYPNPVKSGEIINYSYDENYPDLIVQLYSMQGEIVDSFQLNPSGNEQLKGISNGFYLFRLISDNKVVQSAKLIVY